MLMDEYGLRSPLASGRLPAFGTCAGMILMAREIAVYEVLARRYAPLRSMNLCSVNPPQSIGLIAELHFVENFLKGLETLTVEGLLD
jgi:hypothetical protein